MAYFECLHETKLIVDLIYEGGIANMRYSISNTAEYGDVTRGPRVVTPEVKAQMKKILSEIQSGEFARQWMEESRSGGANFQNLRQKGREHQIEAVGDAFYSQEDVRHILVRHEQAATHAADGYARATGKTGVVLVTSGPGVTRDRTRS